MTDLQGFKSALEEAKSVLITFPTDPSQDIVAASLALYLSLKESKQVSLYAPSLPVVRDSHLVGLDKISSDLGGDNLVITFNVNEDAVDKVTSNTDGGHLNLVISPKAGGEPIQESDISFSRSGASADLVIVVGAKSLADIGEISKGEVITSSKIVNFGNQTGTFGAVNLTDPSSSNSELTAAVIQELKLPLDRDTANNLLIGIESATDNLNSPSITADTFEALAVLYRAGARRIPASTGQPVKIVNDTPVAGEEIELRKVKKSKGPDAPDWLKPKILKSSD